MHSVVGFRGNILPVVPRTQSQGLMSFGHEQPGAVGTEYETFESQLQTVVLNLWAVTL